MRTILTAIALFTLLSAGNSFITAQNAPDGAAFPIPRILKDKTPDSGSFWASARCDITTPHKDVPTNGMIEVDYIEVIQENLTTNQKWVIAREDYDNSGKPITTYQGGLYVRDPWFIPNATPRLLSNSIQQDSILIIYAGQTPADISHIWTPCSHVDPNTRLYVRIRFRITGDIRFQIGLDYSPTSDCSKNNHTEAFVSKWYGDTDGRFEEITIPDYSMKKCYDRSHYGVYTNGKFFLSSEMVRDFDASSVYLKADITQWKPMKMVLEGDYYVFYSNQNHYQKTIYCFKLDLKDNAHIPAILVEKGNNQLLEMSDATGTDASGYNFKTFPLQVVVSEPNMAELNLKLKLSPDGQHLYIISSHVIKRVYITDLSGRISFDYHDQIPGRLEIASLNDGNYILTIETAAGRFSELFRKLKIR